MTPPDCHQLVVCTPCTYEYFAKVKAESRTAYLAEKARVTEQILRQIERHYIPSIRKHIELMVAGTPSTNQRFTMSPMGNAYGANLTPRQINIGKIDYHSPWENLYLVGATAGVPSFAGGVHFAILMFQHLTGLQLGSTAPIAPRIGKYRDGVPLPNLDQSQPLVKVP